jgi:hypothetical protein
MVFVTSQDFIKFWGNFFLLFCLRYLEIHRDLKLLSLFERFIRKLFFLKKLSIIFLKNFFEKDQVSKYYFPSFIQTYASLLAKE